MILMAEKLLQQTRATNSVVEAYQELTTLFPTPDQLAKADLQKLRQIIQPLGFTFRASQLKAMAHEIIERYDGSVPDTYSELMSLPGVGEYGATAVMTFAYEADMAIVDTNVGRFIYRLFGATESVPVNPSRKKHIIVAANLLVPAGNSRNYNLAVLDLCALICTHKNPKCEVCPVQKHCVFGTWRLASPSLASRT